MGRPAVAEPTGVVLLALADHAHTLVDVVRGGVYLFRYQGHDGLLLHSVVLQIVDLSPACRLHLAGDIYFLQHGVAAGGAQISFCLLISCVT